MSSIKWKQRIITCEKLTKHTQDKTGNKFKTHLSTLLSEPEFPEYLAKIYKTQDELQTLEDKIIHNQLCKKADYKLLEGERPTPFFLNGKFKVGIILNH